MAILRISTKPEKQIMIEPVGEIDRDDFMKLLNSVS